MNNRFSKNGDGKSRAPTDRISGVGDHQPTHPATQNNDRERQIIEALKGRYDEIEALWEQAEEDLKRFRIPHAVEYCYDSDCESAYPIHYRLSFTRYGKGWRICHETLIEYSIGGSHQRDELETKPIVECSLDVRVAMIHHFEALRKKVIEAAKNAVPKLDEAISSFRKLLKG
jgi:hypothetical protein